jgi:hypothetical protein
VIAPGVHILGLRVPNSYIDQNNPAGRVDWDSRTWVSSTWTSRTWVNSTWATGSWA